MPEHERLLGHYTLVASDAQDGVESEKSTRSFAQDRLTSKDRLVALLFISLICLAVGYTGGTLLNNGTVNGNHYKTSAASACNNSQFRREWRSLSHQEKDSYIQAIKCLKQTPSRLGLNQSLYDDFPYVHFRVGGYCTLFHDARP